MTAMFIYAGFVVLVALTTTILFRAKQPIPALIVGAAGVFGIVLRSAQEAYDAVEQTGRMEPIAALLGGALVAIIVGVSLADALCDYLSRISNKP